MSEPTEDDLNALPNGELMALPEGAIPPGWLSEFFTRRAAAIYQQNSNELALELSGDSSLHLMIFRDMDPREKRRRREEEERRRLAEQELQEYRDRSDRFLARIEQEQIAVEKRRKQIEDNALKLRDGRRVYVDGNQYRDEQGRVLEGRDRDEAAGLHSQNPNASTWRENRDRRAFLRFREKNSLRFALVSRAPICPSHRPPMSASRHAARQRTA